VNEQIAAAINQLTKNFWFATILYFVVAGIGAFIGAYLLKKAGHLATKEDFADFRAQLNMTTRDTEEIKQQLSRHTWVDQQQWTARELYYGRLLTHLHNFGLALDGLSGYYLQPGSEHTPDSQQGTHFQRLKLEAGQAFDEIQKLLGPAALYLSPTTVDALSKMLSKHWELVEFEVCCTAEYAEQAQQLSHSAYDLVLSEAKQHLGIG
jgi:hypothetical protein